MTIRSQNTMDFSLNACKDKWVDYNVVACKYARNFVMPQKKLMKTTITFFQPRRDFFIWFSIFLWFFALLLTHISFKAFTIKAKIHLTFKRRLKLINDFTKGKRGKHVLKAHCKRFSIVSQSTPATQKVIIKVLKHQIIWNLLTIFNGN